MMKPPTLEQHQRLERAGWRLICQDMDSQEWEDHSIPRNRLTIVYGSVGCVIFKGSLVAMAEVVNLLTQKGDADDAARTD